MISKDQNLVRYTKKSKAAPSLPVAAEIVPEVSLIAEIVSKDPNPAAVYLAGLGSPKSRRTMRGALKRVLLAIGDPRDPLAYPWKDVGYAEAAVIRASLQAQHEPATANHALSALRGVMHECYRLGFISGDAWARIKDTKGFKFKRLPKGHALSIDDLRALFAACDRSTPIGTRDAALLAVLRATGMRRAEVCSINLAELDLAAGEVRIIGKGDKERVAHLGNAAADVTAWLKVRGSTPGALFLSFEAPTGGRHPEGSRRLTEGAVRYILAKLVAKAGIRATSPHDLRRTFISDLFDAKVDMATVQAMAGHDSPDTTSKYDRRDARAARAASFLLEIPR